MWFIKWSFTELQQDFLDSNNEPLRGLSIVCLVVESLHPTNHCSDSSFASDSWNLHQNGAERQRRKQRVRNIQPSVVSQGCVVLCVQAVRLSDHRGRLCFSGLSSELQALKCERAGPELQPSRRLRREAAVGCTGGSTLQTGHSQVQTDGHPGVCVSMLDCSFISV